MRVEGQLSVRAPREEVFARLSDAPFFASCVEGVQDLTEIDPTCYEALFETKVAYMKFRFKVTVEVASMQPPEMIEARVEGRPLGIVGRLTAVTRTWLTQEGDETKITYAVDANLAGKLGSIGQPVLKSKAKEMERKFADRLRAAFHAEQTASEAGPAP
jgi:carbon monoxide dehydrogenase subunit G